MAYPIEDISTYTRCFQCEEVMHFTEAWVEADDLVVILVECPRCGYSDTMYVHPLRQPCYEPSEPIELPQLHT